MGWVTFGPSGLSENIDHTKIVYLEDQVKEEDEYGATIQHGDKSARDIISTTRGRLSGSIGGKVLGFKANYIDRIAKFELEKNLSVEARAHALKQLGRLHDRFKEEDNILVDANRELTIRGILNRGYRNRDATIKDRFEASRIAHDRAVRVANLKTKYGLIPDNKKIDDARSVDPVQVALQRSRLYSAIIQRRIFNRPVLEHLSGAYYGTDVKDIYNGVSIKAAGSLTTADWEIVTAMQIAEQRCDGKFHVDGASSRMIDRIAALAIEYNIQVMDRDVQIRMAQIRRWIDERKQELAVERGMKDVNPVPLPGMDEPIFTPSPEPAIKEPTHKIRDIVDDAAGAIKQLVEDVVEIVSEREALFGDPRRAHPRSEVPPTPEQDEPVIDSNEPGQDGPVPESNEPEQDGPAPESNEPEQDGPAPESNESEQDEPTRGARDIADDAVAAMEEPMNDMADGIARNSEAMEKFLFGGRRRVTGGRGVNRNTRPEIVEPAPQPDVQAQAERLTQEREQEEREKQARIREEQEREDERYFTELSLFPDDNSEDWAMVQAYEELNRIRLERELSMEEQDRFIEPEPEQYKSTLPNGKSVAEMLAGEYPLSQNAVDNIKWDDKNFHGQTVADVRLQQIYEEGLVLLREEAMEQKKAMTYQEQQAALVNMIAQVVEKEVLAAAQSKLADQVRAAQEAQQIQEAQQAQESVKEVETPQAEQPKPEVPQIDQPKPEVPQVDQPKPEVPQVDQPKPEVPQVDQPKPEVPQVDQPKPEVPQVDQPKPEVPQVDQPKPEVPQVDQPKPEVPQVDQPKPEVPQVDQPKAEVPQVDQPKAETPKVETLAPKQEQSVPSVPERPQPRQTAPARDIPQHQPTPERPEPARPRVEGSMPYLPPKPFKIDPRPGEKPTPQYLLMKARADEALRGMAEMEAKILAKEKAERLHTPTPVPQNMDMGDGGEQNAEASAAAKLKEASEQHMKDIADQIRGGVAANDSKVDGHVGYNAHGDNVCVVNDENGNVRAWGIYGDDGTPYVTRGDDDWKDALSKAAIRDIKAREAASKKEVPKLKKDEAEHETTPEPSRDER